MKAPLEHLALAVLNSLEAQIAVFEVQGTIHYVNHAWIRFGQANGLTDTYNWVGKNYLATCLTSAQYGDQDAVEVYAGIQSVIAGKISVFAYEYPCHSRDEQRWFMVRVVPLMELDDAFVASHHAITKHKLIEERIEQKNRELAKIAATGSPS